MNGSLIISGGNKETREDKIIEIINKEEGKAFEKIKDLEDKPDIFIINLLEGEKSIGISQTREGINFLREKPFSYEKKFLVILNAEKMTTQAQNSLLKTLEEPPVYALIILSTRIKDQLIATVVSRCKNINVKNEDDDKNEDLISLEKLLKMDLGERIDICSEISKEEKEDVINMLENWVVEGRKHLLKKPKNVIITTNIKRILDVKKDLENSNVNVKLSLEALVLSLK
jgi:DNA polymerase III delta prime subunit